MRRGIRDHDIQVLELYHKSVRSCSFFCKKFSVFMRVTAFRKFLIY